MMKSMTGYGRGEFMRDGRRFVVEIKAVNSRYRDLNIKLPRFFNCFEDSIRKRIAADIHRGQTDVYINFESLSTEDVAVKLNDTLATMYVERLNEATEKYNLSGGVTLEMLCGFPDVLVAEKTLIKTDADAADEIWQVLLTALEQALEKFLVVREKEGAALKEDIVLRLGIMEDGISKVSACAPRVLEEYKKKLETRLEEVMGQANVDEARIAQELLLFADKSCVDEEITRFKSHLSQMNVFLEESGAIGRKLDFLIQEMNREINTIGSKSSDIETTRLVVALKSEIEKVREQAQNIE